MTNTTYEDLNAEIFLLDSDGNIQFEKDKEATRAYFLEEVNRRTRFFYTLKEKVNYLLDNELWKRETVEMFSFDQFKALFKQAHEHKYRFESFMGARKFFTQYALADVDGNTFVERFEDRVVLTAIDLSGGDYDAAKDLVDAIITGRFQPATPTFLNAGRAQGGERVSCFLLRVEDNTESITRCFTSAAQLSRRGGGVGINASNLRESGATIQKTPKASKGLIPFMKVLEDEFKYFDQLGQRQGAGVVYVNAHHPDIMRVLDTKRENADEAVRLKTLSIGVVIPDITFDLAKRNADMYLFSPSDVEKVEGKAFADLSVTENYDRWVEDERITKSKVNARQFFQTLSELQFESGYPYILFEDEANRTHTLSKVGRIQMSNLCVTGDTELLTENGYRKVIDLYESQEDFNVIVDERARTMNLDNKGTSVQSSTKMFKTAEKAEVWKVTTKEGYEIKATPWHKFYVERNGELVKIPLTEVVEDDRLLVQGAESATHGDIHEPDLAYIAGVMAADGTYAQSNTYPSARIDLYGDKRQFADKVKASVWRILDNREDLCERQATTSPEFVERLSSSPKLSLNSTPLSKALAEVGVGPVNKVSVPDFVKRGDRETRKAFIDGAWAMDGCITGNENVGNISLEMGSIHLDYLQDMQKLLLEFGVYSRIYPGKKIGALAMLPDGNGGFTEYFQSQSWTIRVMDRTSREILHDLVEWRTVAEDYWKKRCSNIKSNRYYSTHKYRATVNSIEFYGVEDVYDVTVDNGNSVVFDGIATGQCSEILQVQSPGTFNEDCSYLDEGADISCNLGSFNIDKMWQLNKEEFIDTVISATKALDQVSRTTSIKSVPSVRKGNELSHSIGLGQMNLHGALGVRRIFYDSDEARSMFSKHMALTTFAAMLASTQLAKEYGTHAYYDQSEYADGSWFRRVVDPWIEEYGDDLEIVDGLSAPTADEWKQLELEVAKYGLANAYLQAVPPTGSISYINHSTSSIHPVAAPIEIRKEGKTGRTYYPAPGMNNDNLEYFQSAAEIGPEATILMYEKGQHWVDQGMSLTLFFPDKVTDAKTGELRSTTTRDINRAQIFAWRHHIKTLYYVRIVQAAMDGTQVDGTAMGLIREVQAEACTSCQL